jgi:Na+-driven multidrug efflux pump
VLTVIGLVVGLGAAQIMGVFFDDSDTIAIGSRILQIVALSFPFIGAYIMMEMIHQGVGLNTPTMVFNVVRSWLLEVLPIYIFTAILDWPVVSVWWTFTGATIIAAVGFYFYYRRGYWLNHTV